MDQEKKGVRRLFDPTAVAVVVMVVVVVLLTLLFFAAPLWL